MSKRVVVLCALGLAAILMFGGHVGASPDKSKAQARIDAAGQRLDSLAVQAPGVPVRSLVSFKKSVKPDEALGWAESHGLQPTALYHAFVTSNNTFRGGYFVRPGESRTEAVANYKERYRSALSGYAAALQRLLDQPPTHEKGDFDPDERRIEQLKTKLADINVQISEFDRTGEIPVYGLEVMGTPGDLKSLAAAQAQHIRLVEVLGQQQPAVPLLPND